MKVLIDTNVIIDVLIKRNPHFESSAAFLKLCGNQITGLLAASQTTDIFYLLRRKGKGAAEAKAVLQKLKSNIEIADVTSADVENALESDMPDYEDALLAFIGQRNKAEWIVSRNEKDYAKSPIPALSPQAFIEKLLRNCR